MAQAVSVQQHRAALILPLLPIGYRVAAGLAADSSRAEELVVQAVDEVLHEPEPAQTGSELKLRFLRHLIQAEDRAPRPAAPTPKRPPATWRRLVGFVRETPFRRVQNALAGLEHDCRVACALHLADGLSYRDLAIVLDCPVAVVRSRLHGGRAQLNRRLAALARRGRGQRPQATLEQRPA